MRRVSVRRLEASFAALGSVWKLDEQRSDDEAIASRLQIRIESRNTSRSKQLQTADVLLRRIGVAQSMLAIGSAPSCDRLAMNPFRFTTVEEFDLRYAVDVSLCPDRLSQRVRQGPPLG